VITVTVIEVVAVTMSTVVWVIVAAMDSDVVIAVSMTTIVEVELVLAVAVTVGVVARQEHADETKLSATDRIAGMTVSNSRRKTQAYVIPASFVGFDLLRFLLASMS
jgi:hypothetical protein